MSSALRWLRLASMVATLGFASACGDDSSDDDGAPGGASGQGQGAQAGSSPRAGSGGTGSGEAGASGEGGASAGEAGNSVGGGTAGMGAAGEGGDGPGSACLTGSEPFEWPVDPEPVTVAPDDSWKGELEAPWDPFFTRLETFSPDAVRWVKFTVMLSDPETVYFQDSNVYSFHYDFATEHIPAFRGMTRQEFDAVTLHTEGQQAVLGAVLVPGDSARNPEFAVQLVLNDPVHPEFVRTIVENVAARVTTMAGETPIYLPNPAQALCMAAHEPYFTEHDLPIDTVDRWLVGDACYAPGWAIGRLVELASSEVPAAYLNGSLRPEDILLLTDAAPAELPFVAGILTLAPSTPNSHTAILARSYSVPFAYLRREQGAERARELVGNQVVVSTRTDPASGDCDVRFIDVEALSDAQRADIRELAVLPAIEIAPKVSSGAYTVPSEGLVPSDIERVGGKAANYGVVLAAAPDHTPTPAFAITFDAWDTFMAQPAPGGAEGTLGDEIARRLAPFTWPADLLELSAVLDGIVDLVRDAPMPDEIQEAVQEALTPFDPMVRIRFRSSTNVEDSETFTGAGLYDSVTGCFADDLDDDTTGPSLCNPEETGERGVFRAIKRVYSSFYAQNAYLQRLRRGVNEDIVGMGVLVHYSAPDSTELANGVATLSVQSPETRIADLVTQLGAISVTNPDGTASPEVVRIERFDTSDFLNTLETSSLLLLGEHVLTWESEYRTLMTLLNDVADEYSRVTSRTPPFMLDFEYKKLEPGVLSLRQVRPLPMPDTTVDVTPYLVGEPTTLCIYPGEVSDVFAMHRLKARIAVESGHGPLTAARLTAGLYDRATVDYVADGETARLIGDPATFAGATHTYVEPVVTDSWTTSAGRWALGTEPPIALARDRSPVVSLADFPYTISATWNSPVPYLDWLAGPQTRTEDSGMLWASCPDTAVLDAGSMRVEREFTAPNDMNVVTSYWFPPPPRGFTAGYTAPIVRWEQTTITGLTSEPIVLRGYFSQSHRPAHHNFGGDYIFEPRLEPGISAAQLAELEALDVQYLVVVDIDSPTDNQFWIAGLDGTLRRLTAP